MKILTDDSIFNSCIVFHFESYLHMIINAFISWIIQPLKEEALFDSQLLKYLFQSKHRPDFFASSTQYSVLVILRGQFERSSNTISKQRKSSKSQGHS